MAEIKLCYFNAAARGEISRLILAYSGVKWTDERMTGDQFRAIKEDTAKLPYGQMPVLHYNGQIIAQSLTVARFLAGELGLTGRTSLESAQVDEVVDALYDLQQASFKCMGAKGDGRAEAIAKFEDTLCKGFSQLETRLTARGGQFFVGNNLSWADLMCFNMIESFCNRVGEDMRVLKVDNYPKIQNLYTRIGQLPNIKAWMSKDN